MSHRLLPQASTFYPRDAAKRLALISLELTELTSWRIQSRDLPQDCAPGGWARLASHSSCEQIVIEHRSPLLNLDPHDLLNSGGTSSTKRQTSLRVMVVLTRCESSATVTNSKLSRSL